MINMIDICYKKEDMIWIITPLNNDKVSVTIPILVEKPEKTYRKGDSEHGNVRGIQRNYEGEGRGGDRCTGSSAVF
jgi:hypothetical protein